MFKKKIWIPILVVILIGFTLTASAWMLKHHHTQRTAATPLIETTENSCGCCGTVSGCGSVHTVQQPAPRETGCGCQGEGP